MPSYLSFFHQYSLSSSCFSSGKRASASSDWLIWAPQEVVSKLLIRVFRKSNIRGNEPLECVICLEEYQDEEEVRVLPCRHEYHTACIDNWPTTRKKFVSGCFSLHFTVSLCRTIAHKTYLGILYVVSNLQTRHLRTYGNYAFTRLSAVATVATVA